MAMAQTATDESRQVVKNFLEDVRSGKNPQNASLYLADTVSVHEVKTDMPENFNASPNIPESGIRERKQIYGDFKLEIKEIILEGEQVFVRWEVNGKQISEVKGQPWQVVFTL
ncbi:hypothetical protein KXD93_21095 [Mucilaginibacter sp. BJC16-A38]|uniref:hypothetical protein n=1 Tax=Mucilaginibacter phenanthrenivorans TaxID=1234842 RepID=UPI00215718BA|nr:hypothetical protein [Mucilaginibacter phenanthrenivorans]MCR8560162.1 hypothetical protein [Mucilaginibacter phenanthrenivorans]